MENSELILVGDVGASKTLLALATLTPVGLKLHEDSLRRFASQDFLNLEALLTAYLQPLGGKPRRACLGVPGPVLGGRCRTTNLPWELEEEALAARLGLTDAVLVNDVAALAWAFTAEPAPQLTPLRQGHPLGHSPLLVVGVGTGLGAAVLVPCQGQFAVLATEAGHCDLAGEISREADLLPALASQMGRVSYERVVSGPGLVWLYRCFAGQRSRARILQARDPAKLIVSERKSDPAAASACQALARYLGAFVGNLALVCLPAAGVVLAGSVAQAILGGDSTGDLREVFFSALVARDRHQSLLASLPVSLLADPLAPLVGCGRLLASRIRL